VAHNANRFVAVGHRAGGGSALWPLAPNGGLEGDADEDWFWGQGDAVGGVDAGDYVAG